MLGNQKFVSMMLVSLLGSFLNLVQAKDLKEVSLVPSMVFAPTGFDQNDNAQIVSLGYLPNTCYKTGKTSYSINHTEKHLEINFQGTVRMDGICLMVQVPYTQEINLGRLPEGNYEVYFVSALGERVKMAVLNIAKTENSNIDEQLYMPITDAFLENTQNAQPVLHLLGTVTNSCLRFKEVKMIQKTTSVLEVLPLAEFVEEGHCRTIQKRFELKIPILNSLKGNNLVHIRSLNGTALNLIAYFE